MFNGLDIRLSESCTQGRYVVATADISYEQEVMRTLPYASGVFEAHRKRVRAACLAQSTHPFLLCCKSCDQLYFCSANCLSIAISSNHHYVCKSFRKLATHKAPLHEKSVLKILISILSRRSFDNGDFFSEWLPVSHYCTQCPFHQERFIEVSIISKPPILTNYSDERNSNPYQPVAALQSHFDNWSKDQIMNWQKIKVFIYKLVIEAELIKDTESIESILELISKIESNCFGIYNEKEQCLGRVMYPLASYFNVK